MSNKLLLIPLFLINFHLFSQDFHPGPYGVEYFDIQGPFILSDLNSPINGDVNGDEIANIQDIILEISYILGTLVDIDWFEEGDMNDDGAIDILDVIMLVNSVLMPSGPEWSFEDNWNGEDSYIFISYSTASGSSTLWNASDREDFLEGLETNLSHYEKNECYEALRENLVCNY